MKTIMLASMLLIGVLQAPVMAQVYKWVDEKGNVHYSDRPQSLDTEPEELYTVSPLEPAVAENMPAEVTDTPALAADAPPANSAEPAAASPPPVAAAVALPAPQANCSAAAENARRILLSQSSKPELRQLAADAGFKASFVQSCRQSTATDEGRAEAVCIQRAKNFAAFQACSG